MNKIIKKLLKKLKKCTCKIVNKIKIPIETKALKLRAFLLEITIYKK